VIRVLFVCAGNICRSPMADAVFQHIVGQAGLADQFKIDSAGTGSWHAGERAHSGTLTVLRKNNIPYDGRARQFDYADLNNFDYILAMDRENLSNILRLVNRGERSAQDKMDRLYGSAHRPEITLFLSYANQAGTVNTTEVPDPYYDGRYELVYDLVTKGCDALLNSIRQKHEI
jgi:protein-tyrosine phosphatase